MQTDTTALIEALEREAHDLANRIEAREAMEQAAATITALRAEVAALREENAAFREHHGKHADAVLREVRGSIGFTARAALERTNP